MHGFDTGYVFRHPVFLVTFIIAIPAWVIAFAGQCAAEAKLTSGNGHTPVAGTLWFTIWVELAVIIHLLRIGGSMGRRDSATTGFAGGEMGISGHSGGISRGISSNHINGGGYPVGGYAPAATEGTPQKAPSVRDNYNQQSPGAMYAYSASPDDPNEVSFAKGDILEVMDNTGKWFQVRTPTGATGIAPSNYLTML
ncbi:high osmolarity signaling protein SHO1 [Kwoniella shandongensis]|uniref:High osmolarity signaling protein SHO1 n=1 Tax=Kwoniella shandongensis TaxID=1734106 RepID=A0AAJ8LFD2_9TREE